MRWLRGEDREELGFAALWAELKPVSEPGRLVKESWQPWQAGQLEEAYAESTRLALYLNWARQHPASWRELGRILAGVRLPQLQDEPDDTCLWTWQLLARRNQRLRRLLVEGLPWPPGWAELPDLAGLAELLAPPEREGEEFSLGPYHWRPLGQTLTDEELIAEILAARRHLGQALLPWSEAAGRAAWLLGQLDWLVCRVNWGLEQEATVPVWAHAGAEISLEEGRHPLLARAWQGEREFVPLSLTLRPGVTVVSGANMGGKTVALRTLGLLVALAHYGLPVPAKRLSLPIGQMLASNLALQDRPQHHLSTFGAEVEGWLSLLNQPPGLVLLDEPARSTGPREGEALLLALLQKLATLGHYVLVTTHLPGLSSWPQFHHYRVVGWLGPERGFSYQLLPGGGSAAGQTLALARALGLPEEIIATAAAYLGGKESEQTQA